MKKFSFIFHGAIKKIMFRFLFRNKGNLAPLIHAFDHLKAVEPDPDFVVSARKRIVSAIVKSEKQHIEDVSLSYIFSDFIGAIQRISSKIGLDAALTSIIRERVYAFATLHPPRTFSSRLHDLLGKKRVWATFMIAVLLVVFPFSFFSSNGVDLTYLRAHGQVFIQRSGEQIEVFDQIVLQEGDTIITNADSTAEIFFPNENVSRLAKDTEVSINALVEHDLKNVVEVELKRGRLWSNVVNASSDQSTFSVKGPEVFTQVKTQASFDMTVDESEVTVSAQSNTVDFMVQKDDQVLQKFLVEGQELELYESSANESVLVVKDTGKSDQWVNENVKKDIVHKKVVLKDYQERLKREAGILPGDILYSVKKLSENAQIALTFHPVMKYNKKLDLAKNRLNEAEALFSEGRNKQAEEVLKEYRDLVQEVYVYFEKTKKQEIQSSLEKHQKKLHKDKALSSVEKVRDSLAAVSEDVLQNVRTKMELNMKRGLDNLFLIRDEMSGYPQEKVVLTHIKKYRDNADLLLKHFQSLALSKRRDFFLTALNQKVDELFILQILAKGASHPVLQQFFEDLLSQLLWDVNTLIFFTQGLDDSGLLEILQEQKNDLFVQETVLNSFLTLVSGETQKNIDRFIGLYKNERSYELLDTKVYSQFSDLVMRMRNVTPDAE